MSEGQDTGAQRWLDSVRRPLGVHFQLTDRCNHNCAHCYQVHGRRAELDTAEALEVLDRLADDGLLMLGLSGGEPTLRSDFLQLLGHARRRQFAVQVLSNGYRLDAAMAEQMAALHPQLVGVSVYSDVAAEHDRVTGVPGSWQAATGALRALASRGVHARLSWVATEASSSSVASMSRLATELGVAFRWSPMINARQDGSDLTTRSMMLRGERLRALLREGLQRGELLPQQQGQRWQDGHPCFACKRGMSVGADGRWMVCTGFDLALGKVTEQRLAQVTGTPEASFWAELTWNGVHGCRDCELLRYCHRCHADALLQAGDLLGPYDPACAMTRAVYAEATGRSSELASRCRAEPVGPFRLVAGGLEQLPDLMTAHDMSVRERFSWVLRQVDKKAAPKHTSGMTWERRS